MIRQTEFNIGQVVYHTKQKYRGIIIDVDSSFQPRGVYAMVLVRKNIASEFPWYRVLVDNTNHITYVKEPLLKADDATTPINHPDIKTYFSEENGHYKPHFPIN